MVSIEKNNPMIAEFMGLNDIVQTDGITFKDNNTATFHELLYHTSWEWLMSVFDKIEDLGYVIITKSTPTISGKWYMHEIEIEKDSWGGNRGIILVQSDYTNNESKKSTYYRAVVSFIEWYNKNKGYDAEH